MVCIYKFCLFVCTILLWTVTDMVQGKYLYNARVHGWIGANKIVANWDEARRNCSKAGAVLASPVTEELLDYMRLYVAAYGHTNFYFIGMRQKSPAEIQYVSLEGVLLENMPEAVYDMIEKLDPRDGECLSMNGGSIRVVSCLEPLPYICYTDETIKRTILETSTTKEIITESTTLHSESIEIVNTTTPPARTETTPSDFKGTASTEIVAVDSITPSAKSNTTLPHSKVKDSTEFKEIADLMTPSPKAEILSPDSENTTSTESREIVDLTTSPIKIETTPPYSKVTESSVSKDIVDTTTSMSKTELSSPLYSKGKSIEYIEIADLMRPPTISGTSTPCSKGTESASIESVDPMTPIAKTETTPPYSKDAPTTKSGKIVDSMTPPPKTEELLPDSEGFPEVLETTTDTATTVPTTTMTPAPNCNNDEYKYYPETGKCYRIEYFGKNWDTANITCEEEGAYLVILNDEVEANIVTNILVNENVYLRTSWVGLRDDELTGDWRSIHGQSVAELYSKRNGYKPRYATPQACGTLLDDGTLYNYNCGFSLSFICEKDIK